MKWTGPGMNLSKVVVLLSTATLLIILFYCREDEYVISEFKDKSSEEYIKISPFDEYFRKYADTIVCDWMFLAAIAYVESKFDTSSVSHQGALGVMQLMPKTYRHMLEMMNVTDTTDFSTEMNIRVGAEYLAFLDDQFSFIDKKERMNYVLASYNGGPGHIFDAMRIARKLGINRYRWENLPNVFKMMTKEEIFTDSICKCGKFEGEETIRYVEKVQRKYKEYITLENKFFSKNNHLGKTDELHNNN